MNMEERQHAVQVPQGTAAPPSSDRNEASAPRSHSEKFPAGTREAPWIEVDTLTILCDSKRFEPGQMIYFGLRIRVGATVKCVVGSLLTLGVIWAQDAPRPQVPAPARPQTQAQKDAQRRLGLVATRAIANFHSADSIEANLNRHGHSLHPQIVALRLRIEAALDEAQKAIDQGDPAAANEELDMAQALLQRFIQRLGGA